MTLQILAASLVAAFLVDLAMREKAYEHRNCR